MNCPACNRNNEFNLSICPSCGAMMNDSVRAELLSKISVCKSLKNEKIKKKEISPVSDSLDLPPVAIKEEINPPPAVVSAKSVVEAPAIQNTSELDCKPTSPTLIEFHSKKSSIPEWRLQLQNAVRQRGDRENQPSQKSAAVPQRAKLATSGANALKVEIVEEKKPARLKNPTLSSALERIEKSRQKFLVEELVEKEAQFEPISSAPRPANKNFPFYIASKQVEVETKAPEPNAPPVIIADKPKLAAPIVIESGDLDTNKLPSLAPPAKISTNFIKVPASFLPTEIKIEEKKKVEIKPLEREEEIVAAEETNEEFEDTAPFAMRFNAGLFDLIIGGFLSLLLLSPFMLTGGDWFTFTGLLAFLATCSVVMFIYLTTTIGFYGRTFGMRLFSLEVIDMNGENYPTLHQAAVSSAVYILSLALGGIGFLPLFFNDEKRAVHDLVSGTVVVKEN